MGVRLTPVIDLRAEADSDGLIQYEAEGIDPQFQVGLEGDEIGSLAAGWYLVETTMLASSGEVARPCFYADYGSGYAESLRIDLPDPGRGGVLLAVVLIKAPLRALRFDPSVRPARFRMGAMRFRPISRAAAALQMILRARGGTSVGEASPGRWAVAREFARNLLLHGRSTAAQCLVRRYVAGFGQPAGDYQHWLRLFELPRHGPGALSRDGQLKNGPLVSIVMPVFDPPVELLRRAIDSVREQAYQNWQLCIADDASRQPQVRKLLHEAAAADPRIQVRFRAGRGHICEAANTAMDLVQGAYVGFLDHDDELHPDALRHVVQAIAAHPQARLFYTDEDKIDPEGVRSEPHFKPGWNPALLRAQNYICHFMVIEAALLGQVGAFRPGLEGAQDHDLVLRCAEQLDADQIVHVPKVLYHWRTIPGSTATGAEAKPYAREAGRVAVVQHMQRLGVEADVLALDNGYYRVRPRLPDQAPRVSIVIPTRDRAELLRKCMVSLLRLTRYEAYEIVLVDNGSVEPDAVRLLEELAHDSRIRVVRNPSPFNFSRLVNHGVERSRGEYVCLLNNDTEIIDPDWLLEMVSQASMPDAGAVGAMLYYPDDTIQHAGVVLGIGGVAGHAHSRLARGAGGYMSRASVLQNLSAVTGACLLVRRSLFDEVGGFDEELAVAFNDVDFCLRVASTGRHNVWTPFAELYHHESVSRGYEDTPEKQARFRRETMIMRERWGILLDNDPAYNPNLSLEHQDYSLAFPPRTGPRPTVGWAAMRFQENAAVAG